MYIVVDMETIRCQGEEHW